MGLEPTIFCSVGRRVIHYATRLSMITICKVKLKNCLSYKLLKILIFHCHVLVWSFHRFLQLVV